MLFQLGSQSDACPRNPTNQITHHYKDFAPLALRLAEASYLAAVREDEPIVLLDDVLSEMDGSRRQRVLEKIAGYGQTIISTTDLEPIREFFGANAAYFQVDGGTVTPLDIAT